MRKIVALGASVGLIGYDEELLLDAIRESFKGRKAEAAEMNVLAVQAAPEYARSQFVNRPERQIQALPVPQRQPRTLFTGVQAVGIAKLKAGLGLPTYHPIRPAAEESAYVQRKGPSYQAAGGRRQDG